MTAYFAATLASFILFWGFNCVVLAVIAKVVSLFCNRRRAEARRKRWEY